MSAVCTPSLLFSLVLSVYLFSQVFSCFKTSSGNSLNQRRKVGYDWIIHSYFGFLLVAKLNSNSQKVLPRFSVEDFFTQKAAREEEHKLELKELSTKETDWVINYFNFEVYKEKLTGTGFEPVISRLSRGDCGPFLSCHYLCPWGWWKCASQQPVNIKLLYNRGTHLHFGNNFEGMQPFISGIN